MRINKTATVLIVDDSPEDRGVYKAFLSLEKDCAYTFLEADDADDGLRLYQQAQVDLIFLDFEMPDLTGLDFIERLRDLEGGLRTPVVMITGRGSEQVAVEALKSGVADYLVKSSVTPESLYRAVQNALEKAELTARLAKETAERLQAEQELRESEERFRMLVESVKDYAIVMLDREGRITSWNAGARKMFGYHDKEILGQHFRKLFVPDDARSRAPERELEEAGLHERASDDRWHLRKDGSRFWAAGSVFPVKDIAGTHRGYSKVLRDTTERRQTLMRLEEALTSRNEFLSIAAHELKTPVTSLLLKAQGLLRTLEKPNSPQPSPDRERNALREISAQTERVAGLIENLLDVSRVLTNRLPLRPEPLELGAVVRDVVQRHADQLDPSHRLFCIETPQVAVGLWDRSRLERVLLNVLGNAAKYAPGKPVAIRVRQSDGKAYLSVSDQGPGIELRDQERIFERFERAASSEASGLGLGLGLYISRHLLQAFGGTINVESTPGQGATFTIELPIGDYRDFTGAAARV